MIVGACKIISNDSNGKYTVTQVYPDLTAPDFATANMGLSSVTALDVQLRDTASAGTTAYPFMSIEGRAGAPIVVIDIGAQVESDDIGKVMVDAADTLAYMEDQIGGGDDPGTVNEENLKVEKVNVADDDDIMKVRHTTHGAVCYTVCSLAGDKFTYDENGHFVCLVPAPTE